MSAQAQFSPFERGHASYLRGQPAPGFSTPGTSWEARLFARGWDAAFREANAIYVSRRARREGVAETLRFPSCLP